MDQVDAWNESPSLVLLGEGSGTWPVLRNPLSAAAATGFRVDDARIAAVCLATGMNEFRTADRDDRRFPRLLTHKPPVRS